MKNMNPKVSVIILNWNGWKDTIECLESLYQINYHDFDVVLVDNDSKNDSIEKIREYCKAEIEPKSKFTNYNPKNKPITIYEFNKEDTEIDKGQFPDKYHKLPHDRRLILIKNDKNYGFAEGNNIGMKFALKTFNPAYILLLNNDTVVEPHFLSEMVKTGEMDKKIAVIGSKTYFYDYNGHDNVIWSVGGKVDLSRYPGYHDLKLDENQPLNKNSTLEVDWISGAVMLIKTKLLPLKLLNSNFFFGCEDVDICIEMEKKGFKMVTNLNSEVWHKAGVSKRKVRFMGITREIKTNLKFMKAHEKHYNLHLPIYILQIIYRYSSMLIKRLARDVKNSIV